MPRQRIPMDDLIDETFQELGPDGRDRRIDWQRHGGRTWAAGVASRGATVYFSMPTSGKV